MNRGNRKPSERAIIYASAVGGLSLDQTRELLVQAGFSGVLPDSSWEMLQRKYVPKFKEDSSLIGECIYSPRPMGDLD